MDSSEQQPELTLEDIYADPNRFGLPTFDEFVKRPERYRESPTRLFDSVERGSQIRGLRDLIQREEFYIDGYKARSLEDVERIANNQGYRLDQLEIKPQIIPQGNGKCIVRTHFKVRDGTR